MTCGRQVGAFHFACTPEVRREPVFVGQTNAMACENGSIPGSGEVFGFFYTWPASC